MCRTAFTEPQCLYSTAFLYSPQCLYNTTIPLLPLCGVQPVQSLSACTIRLYLYSPQCLYSTAIPLLPSVPVEYSYNSSPLSACTVQLYLYPLSACTVQLYLYSPYAPYSFYRASVLYSTAIPLLPSVPVQYSYTSTPFSACTVQL